MKSCNNPPSLHYKFCAGHMLRFSKFLEAHTYCIVNNCGEKRRGSENVLGKSPSIRMCNNHFKEWEDGGKNKKSIIKKTYLINKVFYINNFNRKIYIKPLELWYLSSNELGIDDENIIINELCNIPDLYNAEKFKEKNKIDNEKLKVKIRNDNEKLKAKKHKQAVKDSINLSLNKKYELQNITDSINSNDLKLKKFEHFGNELYYKSIIKLEDDISGEFERIIDSIQSILKIKSIRFFKKKTNYKTDIEYKCITPLLLNQIQTKYKFLKYNKYNQIAKTRLINDKDRYRTNVSFKLRVIIEKNRINLLINDILLNFKDYKVNYSVPIETLQLLTYYYEYDINKNDNTSYYQFIKNNPNYLKQIKKNQPKKQYTDIQKKNCSRNVNYILDFFDNISSTIASKFEGTQLLIENKYPDINSDSYINNFLKLIQTISDDELVSHSTYTLNNAYKGPKEYKAYSHRENSELKIPFITLIDLDLLSDKGDKDMSKRNVHSSIYLYNMRRYPKLSEVDFFTITQSAFYIPGDERTWRNTSYKNLLKVDKTFIFNEEVHTASIRNIVNSYKMKPIRRADVNKLNLLKDRSQTIIRELNVRDIFSEFVGRKEDGSFDINTLKEYAKKLLERKNVKINDDLEFDRIIDDAGIMFLLNTYYIVKYYNDFYIYRTDIEKDDLTKYAKEFWLENDPEEFDKIYKYKYLKIPIELVSIKKGFKENNSGLISLEDFYKIKAKEMLKHLQRLK